MSNLRALTAIIWLPLATGCNGPEAPASGETVAALVPAAGGGQLCTGKCAPDGVSVQEIEGGLRLVHEGACLVADIQGELARTISVNAVVIEGTATSVDVKPCPRHFSTQGDEPEHVRLKGKMWHPSDFVVVAFEKELDLKLDGVGLVADQATRALTCGGGAPQLEMGKAGLTRFSAAGGDDQEGSAALNAAGGVFVDPRGGSTFDALARTISIPSTAAGDRVSLVLDAPAFQGGCQGKANGFQGGCVTRFQGGCGSSAMGFQGGCGVAADGFQGGCVAVEADFSTTIHTVVIGDVLHVVER